MALPCIGQEPPSFGQMEQDFSPSCVLETITVFPFPTRRNKRSWKRASHYVGTVASECRPATLPWDASGRRTQACFRDPPAGACCNALALGLFSLLMRTSLFDTGDFPLKGSAAWRAFPDPIPTAFSFADKTDKAFQQSTSVPHVRTDPPAGPLYLPCF